MLKIHFTKNGKVKIEFSIFIHKRKNIVFVFINIRKRKHVDKSGAGMIVSRSRRVRA